MKMHRVAVVGCGSIARIWVEYLLSREDCRIVSLTNRHLQAAQRMAEDFGIDCKLYANVREAVQDKPDLLFDLTIPESHFDVTTCALKAGIDVFAEKPISNRFDVAKKIIETARETGRVYTVMQNRRFLHQLRNIRAFLDADKLGKPAIVTADFFIGPHFGGFRDVMESPLLIDMSIHTMDQCRYIMGADPVSVTCHEFNPEGSWYAGNCAAICTFEMSNGGVFSYRGCWCAEGIHTSWQSQWRIVCPGGSIQWDGVGEPVCGIPRRPDPFELLNDCVPVEIPKVYAGREEHFGCLDEMFTAYDSGRKAETDCEDNIKSVAMAFAAIKSAKEQRKVYISEIM